MSWHRVNIALCQFCGRDVARPDELRFRSWQVWCSPERIGCDARSATGESEVEAIRLWNMGLAHRPGGGRAVA